MFNRIISTLAGSVDKSSGDNSKNELERNGIFIKKIDEIPEIFGITLQNRLIYGRRIYH